MPRLDTLGLVSPPRPAHHARTLAPFRWLFSLDPNGSLNLPGVLLGLAGLAYDLSLIRRWR